MSIREEISREKGEDIAQDMIGEAASSNEVINELLSHGMSESDADDIDQSLRNELKKSNDDYNKKEGLVESTLFDTLISRTSR